MKITAPILLFFLSSPLMAQNQVHLLSSRSIDYLEQTFNSAQAPDQSISNVSWSCYMYGVKSMKSIKKPLKLYNLNFVANNKIQNTGSQLVKTYQKTSKQLEGSRSSITDQIRLTQSKHLISKLSSANNTTIGYTYCSSRLSNKI